MGSRQLPGQLPGPAWLLVKTMHLKSVKNHCRDLTVAINRAQCDNKKPARYGFCQLGMMQLPNNRSRTPGGESILGPWGVGSGCAVKKTPSGGPSTSMNADVAGAPPKKNYFVHFHKLKSSRKRLEGFWPSMFLTHAHVDELAPS